MTKRFLIILLILSTVLAACTAAQPTTIESGANNTAVSPTTDSGSGYPPPAQSPLTTSSYPEPADSGGLEIYATPGPIPAPASDSGVVTGKLQVQGNPVVNVNVVLAELVMDDKGEERVVSYDRATSPKALTDGEGQFVFADIPPGRYGLVLDTVLSSAFLHTPDENEPFLVTVEAGKELNLGEMNYESLPVPDDLIQR